MTDPANSRLRGAGGRGARRALLAKARLGAGYFEEVGRSAEADRAITADERAQRLDGTAGLARSGALFGSVNYFLFTANLPVR